MIAREPPLQQEAHLPGTFAGIRRGRVAEPAPPQGSGFPPQLAGRVEPAVWAKFVRALSSLSVEQPSLLEALLCCKCCTSGVEFRSALTQFETAFGPRLGATGFSDRVYSYQVWVPAGTGGNAVAHWETRQIYYVRVDFATPLPSFLLAGMPMMQQPAMQLPMMQQPGVMMQQNPMMQMQPVPQYAQQPGVMMQQPAMQMQMQPQGGYYAPR